MGDEGAPPGRAGAQPELEELVEPPPVHHQVRPLDEVLLLHELRQHLEIRK